MPPKKELTAEQKELRNAKERARKAKKKEALKEIKNKVNEKQPITVTEEYLLSLDNKNREKRNRTSNALHKKVRNQEKEDLALIIKKKSQNIPLTIEEDNRLKEIKDLKEKNNEYKKIYMRNWRAKQKKRKILSGNDSQRNFLQEESNQHSQTSPTQNHNDPSDENNLTLDQQLIKLENLINETNDNESIQTAQNEGQGFSYASMLAFFQNEQIPKQQLDLPTQVETDPTSDLLNFYSDTSNFSQAAWLGNSYSEFSENNLLDDNSSELETFNPNIFLKP